MNHFYALFFESVMKLAVIYLSDTGVTDFDPDPDLDTIFFQVSALPCNLKAAITA